MYAFDEVAAEAEAFRAAFARGQGFRPLYVKLKLIYGCNLRCQMCQHWREARPLQLSTARLREVLSELAQMGCHKVHFTGGEPSLRPDLEELIAHATGAGLRVTMTTNATRMTRPLARRLVEAGLRGVNVSLDAPTPAVHDAQRGLPGAWEQAVEGAKNLRKEAHRGKLRLAINTVVTRLNYETLAAMPSLALRVGAAELRLLPVDDHLGLGLRPTPAEIARFNAEVAPLLARRALRSGLFHSEDAAYPFGRDPAALAEGARGLYALSYYRRHPCFAPFTHALIDHDGDVHVCCSQRVAPLLGNVRERAFAETWRGEAYRHVRLSMRDGGRLPACHRCDDFVKENRRLQGLLDGGPEAQAGASVAAPPSAAQSQPCPGAEATT